MIEIEGKIVSSDLLTERFLCDLGACRGICCVEGNAGAPLEEDEVVVLRDEFSAYRPFMTAAGLQVVEDQGFAVRDEDGDLVSPLVGAAECAYSTKRDGVTLCAIEQAYNQGVTSFRKPISCHLYPIRVVRFGDGTLGLNYHRWAVCEGARRLGSAKGVAVYKMLREAIVRRFGEEFYEALEAADEYINKS